MTMGGVSLGVCLLAGGGVYYTHGLIDEVEIKIAEKATAVLAADAKIKQTRKVETEVIILRENLGEYVKILPDDKELIDFVRMLQRFERESGIKSTGLQQAKGSRGNAKGRFAPISYTFDMTATLWQGLKFMNLIENFERFVSITDFSIKKPRTTGDVKTIDGEVVHSIKLTMQTYKYNKAAVGQEVTIPGYEDRMAELREEIWKRMQEIRLTHYEHPGVQGRRDIFVDPRENGLAGGSDPSNADQRDILEKNIGAVADLNKMLEKSCAEGTTLLEQLAIDLLFKSKLTGLLASLDKDAAFIVYRPYRLRWAQEVVAPIEQLQRQVDTRIASRPKTADPYLPKDEIQKLIVLMTDDCNRGQLEQARQRYESVQERLAVPAADPRYGLVVDAKSWHHKASTALDFKRLDLNIQGVVVNGTGRSGMLLNGEVFEEGDYIADDLLVKQVEEEQVWFVFRGLTLVRTM
jgi:hypothetical protein